MAPATAGISRLVVQKDHLGMRIGVVGGDEANLAGRDDIKGEIRRQQGGIGRDDSATSGGVGKCEGQTSGRNRMRRPIGVNFIHRPAHGAVTAETRELAQQVFDIDFGSGRGAERIATLDRTSHRRESEGGACLWFDQANCRGFIAADQKGLILAVEIGGGDARIQIREASAAIGIYGVGAAEWSGRRVDAAIVLVEHKRN